MFCWGGGRDPAHKWKCLTAFTWPCYRIFLTPDQIQQLSVSLCLSFSKHSTYLSSNKSLKTDFILQIIATTAHCAVDWSDTEKARSNPALCCVHKYPIQLIIKIIILLLLLLKNYHPTYITKYRREEYKKKLICFVWGTKCCILLWRTNTSDVSQNKMLWEIFGAKTYEARG